MLEILAGIFLFLLIKASIILLAASAFLLYDFECLEKETQEVEKQKEVESGVRKISDWQKALMIIFFWILIQVCEKWMKKIAPHDKIYPFWANLVAMLMTFYFIFL